MTTKYITTYIASGYTVAKGVYTVDISPTGGVGPEGIFAPQSAYINNDGRINGGPRGSGVFFSNGGKLVNGSVSYTNAVTQGLTGIYFVFGASGTVHNFGTIRSIISYYQVPSAGIRLGQSGTITNGSYADHTAVVEGGDGVFESHAGSTTSVTNYGTILGQAAIYGSNAINGAAINIYDTGIVTNGDGADTSARLSGRFGVVMQAAGYITNYGTISGTYLSGAFFRQGGQVTNGAPTDTAATISGAFNGVEMIAAGTVTNFGVIAGLGGHYGAGVDLNAGGLVVNGSAAGNGAAINGLTGVLGGKYGQATVDNFGVIDGAAGAGIALYDGGRVVNGAAASPGATVHGYQGVVLNAAGTVANYGNIRGYGVASNKFGVYLTSGGTVINGAGTDRKATIEGAAGVGIVGGAGTIHNGGTIEADDNSQNAFGVLLGAGGSVDNGSANNHNALIQGAAGLYLVGGSGQNFGTISAVGDSGSGVKLTSGASITNGTARHTGAIIEGYNGVATPTGGAATVTNFGTIEGTNAAIYFRAATDVLNVEAGSTFLGANYGGGGTLDLASGTGTISNLFASTGVVVSGSMAATTFQGFGTVEVGAGATFTDAGAVTLAVGQTVAGYGALTLGSAKGAVANGGLLVSTIGGTLTIAGALSNSGTVSSNRGTVTITGSVTNSGLIYAGVGTIAISGSVVNTGTILDVGSSLTIGGPVSGAGLLSINGGTMVVSGAVTGTGKVNINGGVLEFGSSFAQGVTFLGSLGELELAQSQTYTGTITGFSKTSSTSLDLLDIGFVSASEATFSGTTAGGVLTVTDGTHTAKINLKGNYTASTFVCSSDGHGGVIVVDPAKTAAPASPLAMLSAMAGLGAPAAVATRYGTLWSDREAIIVSPGRTAA